MMDVQGVLQGFNTAAGFESGAADMLTAARQQRGVHSALLLLVGLPACVMLALPGMWLLLG